MANDLAATINFVSYQDAYDQTYRTTHSEATALKRLEKAIEAGDDLLVKAIRKMAQQHGWNVSLTIESEAQKAHDGFQSVLAQYKDFAQKINDELMRGDITPKRAEDVFVIKSAAADGPGKVDAIVGRVESLVASADRMVAAEIGKLTATPGSTQDQLLAEMRLTKVWDRVRRGFDATLTDSKRSILQTVLDRLRKATDPFEVAVIIEEGPSYLAINGVKDAQTYINGELKQIRPEIGEAVTHAAKADRLQIVIMHDARHVRNALSNRRDAVRGVTVGYVDPTTTEY